LDICSQISGVGLCWVRCGLALLLTVSYARNAKLSGNLSATTPVAMLLTLALGAFAAHGNITLALSAAVIGAVLLDLKPTLHGWLRLIDHRELTASLQLLVLSTVILPYLPNTGLGPYAALNPYHLWWAVILIAGLSLTGHFAMRITGAQRGVLWTGILGGLASSTATTLALARYAREQPSPTGAAVAARWHPVASCFFAWSFCWASSSRRCCPPSAAPWWSLAWHCCVLRYGGGASWTAL
jgi:uncharacterized membrane protein (DUF4010 family)